MAELVIVGDSFAKAVGASSPSAGYAAILGHACRLRVKVVAAGGTGFINTGRRRGNHGHRRLLVPRKRALLLIQSSANDRFWTLAELGAAMSNYLDRLPGQSRTVITGAMWCGADGRDKLHIVTEAARTVARTRGLQFIDTTAWFSNAADIDELFHFDGHPTDKGHALIAKRILAEL